MRKRYFASLLVPFAVVCLTPASWSADADTAQMDAATHAIMENFILTTDFPRKLDINVMPPGPGTADVLVHVSLRNNSGKDTVLSSSPCMIHNWVLVDKDGREVDREHKPTMCPLILMMHLLKANETVSDQHHVVLDGKKLHDGETYHLRYYYWGFQKESLVDIKLLH